MSKLGLSSSCPYGTAYSSGKSGFTIGILQEANVRSNFTVQRQIQLGFYQLRQGNHNTYSKECPTSERSCSSAADGCDGGEASHDAQLLYDQSDEGTDYIAGDEEAQDEEAQDAQQSNDNHLNAVAMCGYLYLLPSLSSNFKNPTFDAKAAHVDVQGLTVNDIKPQCNGLTSLPPSILFVVEYDTYSTTHGLKCSNTSCVRYLVYNGVSCGFLRATHAVYFDIDLCHYIRSAWLEGPTSLRGTWRTLMAVHALLGYILTSSMV
ncbi:hypothetical protein H257_16964 [Aphanomyces astaci]|uniref:Uncharacterized protein n=1 Tax=Aphanomyces astaci TaxID=112090 RepID=W4FGM9_APHAT|nr:hypothetical protein H257_16964 [Aphanomyces astaci]ETV66662.1 hypothetical protein H257_16964 [Aphanomyces astaci]|eukprot:XP_009843890.1 hypothetical protein H257_16964 [Aphanomyces astaci]